MILHGLRLWTCMWLWPPAYLSISHAPWCPCRGEDPKRRR